MNRRTPITNFLIFCSAADRDILDMEECRGERTKYASIGLTVLLTGLFAFVSGSYALYRVFINAPSPIAFALPLGALWGLMVFNLDRLMVGTIRKTDSFPRQLGSAVPRLVLAALIALVVAKPLEVRLFSDRLEAVIQEMHFADLVAGKEGAQSYVDLDSRTASTLAADEELAAQRRRQNGVPDTDLYATLQDRLREAEALRQASISDEAEVQGQINAVYADSNSRVPNDSTRNLTDAARRRIRSLVPLRTAARDRIAEAEATRDETRAAIRREEERFQEEMTRVVAAAEAAQRDAQERLKEAEQQAESLIVNNEAAGETAYSQNFITQVEALGQLTSVPFTTMWWTGFLIMALFFVVETAPVVVKLLAGRGPYDEILAAYEEATREAQADNAKALKALNAERNAVTRKYELDIHKQILEETAEAQLEVARRRLEDWKDSEIASARGGDGTVSNPHAPSLSTGTAKYPPSRGTSHT